MAKSKTCKVSKGCGNSCISVAYLCQLGLNESDAKQLDKMADLLVNRAADLKTPEQAADWLQKNAEALAVSGGGSWGSPEGDLVVVGVEPGMGKDTYYQNNDRNQPLRERLSQSPLNETPGEKDSDFINRNPILVTNEVKTNLELDTLYDRNTPEQAGLVRNRPTSYKLRPETESKAEMPGELTMDQLRVNLSGSKYARSIDTLTEGAGLRTITNINPSPIGLPTADSWPFKNLPLPSGSPFSTREKWLKYVEPRLSADLTNRLSNSKTKVVLIGSGAKTGFHSNLFNSLSQKSGATRVVDANINTVSKSGRNKSTMLRYFLTKEGKLVLQTNHPSAPTWSSAEKKAVNKVMRDYREAVRRAKLEGREGDAERLLETMQQL